MAPYIIPSPADIPTTNESRISDATTTDTQPAQLVTSNVEQQEHVPRKSRNQRRREARERRRAVQEQDATASPDDITTPSLNAITAPVGGQLGISSSPQNDPPAIQPKSVRSRLAGLLTTTPEQLSTTTVTEDSTFGAVQVKSDAASLLTKDAQSADVPVMFATADGPVPQFLEQQTSTVSLPATTVLQTGETNSGTHPPDAKNTPAIITAETIAPASTIITPPAIKAPEASPPKLIRAIELPKVTPPLLVHDKPTSSVKSRITGAGSNPPPKNNNLTKILLIAGGAGLLVILIGISTWLLVKRRRKARSALVPGKSLPPSSSSSTVQIVSHTPPGIAGTVPHSFASDSPIHGALAPPPNIPLPSLPRASSVHPIDTPVRSMSQAEIDLNALQAWAVPPRVSTRRVGTIPKVSRPPSL